jgi:hypothetical protein
MTAPLHDVDVLRAELFEARRTAASTRAELAATTDRHNALYGFTTALLARHGGTLTLSNDEVVAASKRPLAAHRDATDGIVTFALTLGETAKDEADAADETPQGPPTLRVLTP